MVDIYGSVRSMSEGKTAKHGNGALGPESWDAYYEAETQCKTYDPREDPNEEMRVELALSLLRNVSSLKEILDVGCGEGYLLSALDTRYGAPVAGLDISVTRLKRAHANCRMGRFVVGDVRKLPFADGVMDLVSAVEVVEHIAPPEAALAEMVRVSRRYVLVTVPFERPPQIVLCPHCLKTFAIDGHINEFTTRKLQKLLRDAGVTPIETIEYVVASPWSRNRLLSMLPAVIKTSLDRVLVRAGLTSKRVPKYVGVLGEKRATA
jgi:ubiquinone/menaquinone biosynthesis C-methylase UbiE